jgi:hypothetical protein
MGVDLINRRVECIRKLIDIFLCWWVYVKSLWDEKANECIDKGFRLSFTMYFLDFWLKVGVTSYNRLV